MKYLIYYIQTGIICYGVFNNKLAVTAFGIAWVVLLTRAEQISGPKDGGGWV